MVRPGLAVLLCGLALSGCDRAGPDREASTDARTAKPVETCSPPLPHWRTSVDGFEETRNTVAVAADGTIAWNGSPLSRQQLQESLAYVSTLVPAPATILKVRKGADCAVANDVRQQIDEALQCELSGMCAEVRG